MSSRAIKCLVVIGCAALGIWLLGHFLLQFGHISGSNPRSTFEYLVTKPVPPSVDTIQEGGFRTMDSVFRVLCFNIGTSDIRNILDAQGYKPVGRDELKRWDPRAGEMASISHEDYLKGWEVRIQSLTKLKVHFTSD